MRSAFPSVAWCAPRPARPRGSVGLLTTAPRPKGRPPMAILPARARPLLSSAAGPGSHSCAPGVQPGRVGTGFLSARGGVHPGGAGGPFCAGAPRWALDGGGTRGGGEARVNAMSAAAGIMNVDGISAARLVPPFGGPVGGPPPRARVRDARLSQRPGTVSSSGRSAFTGSVAAAR